MRSVVGVLLCGLLLGASRVAVAQEGPQDSEAADPAVPAESDPAEEAVASDEPTAEEAAEEDDDDDDDDDDDEPEMVPANEPMMLSGAVFSALGGGGALVGAGVLIAGVFRRCPADEAGVRPDDCSDRTLPTTIGIAVLASSAGLLALGIPLWAVGGQDVPPDQVSWVPEALVGPASMTLRWRF